MAKGRKSPLPFDRTGGVIAIQRALIASDVFLAVSPQAKSLMLLLQSHWRPDQPVAYGIREAMKKIPCARATAINTFKELAEAGFIRMVDESFFCTRTTSRSRTWRLTWLPYNSKEPTNEWRKIKLTGPFLVPDTGTEVSEMNRSTPKTAPQVSNLVPIGAFSGLSGYQK